MDREQVKEHFRRQVHEYEAFMCRIVPAYEFQTELLIDLIPFDTTAPIRVLDLGSGPGTLSEKVLERFPKAELVAFDLTAEMLEVAKQRCSRFDDRFTAVAGDFAADDFGVDYDLVLAGFSLHHLDAAQRQAMFHRIFAGLLRGGVFIAREVTTDEDDFVAEWHARLWRKFMADNGEDAEYWYRKHRSKDHPTSVENQTECLRDAGFVHVACHWRYIKFAVLSAHKTFRSGHSRS
jgi:tRNA (cmo5U34)-methyltransferase